MAAGKRLIGLSDLRRVTESSIHRAGPRYTPALDPNAPNLRIAPLVEAFDALAYSEGLKSRLLKLESELRETWSRLSPALRQTLTDAAEASVLGAEFLTRIRIEPPGSAPQLEEQLHKANDDARSTLWSYQSKLETERRNQERDSKEWASAGSKIDEARRLGQTLDELAEFIDSAAFRAIYNNRIFLQGSWGTGKTHFLCDVAKERLALEQPTLLILAQTLPAGTDPLVALFESSGLGSDVNSALHDLDSLGQEAGGRALILVDAINEGDRLAWHDHLDRAVTLLESHQNVGLVLSCRSPFEQQILTGNSRKSFIFAEHIGFTDIEFDAQSEFFRYYRIPNPHVPLLAPEFSTPLFLKILCESIAKLSESAKKRRIRSFASGHKGMTKLLEDFVGQIGAGIEKDFGLTKKTCWRILKGHRDAAGAIGIAPKMAELMDDQILLTDAVAIVAKVTQFDGSRARELIDRMASDGLLSEDSRYQDGNWIDTVRLPYQRFSDHLISRHLLARHLDVTSAATVRKCFRPTEPLGQVFRTSEWGGYEMPGLVSAVMLEFPERVKRSLHRDRQELAYYLPMKMRTYALSEPFIEGLLWRDTDSFSAQTDKLVHIFLDAPEQLTRQAMLEALVSLASRPDHRYQADKLYDYLWGMSIPDRDILWTEFLRSRDHTAAAYRVLDWVQQPHASRMEESTAKNLIKLISLLLTSTVRPLRDRATHCLVLLGEWHPGSLFSEVSRSFAFNDPYVRERMLAAAYGVLMRQWASSPTGLKEAALPLALELRDRLAGTDDEAPIEHILMRDCAQGCIELTAKILPNLATELLENTRPVSPKTVLRRPSRISEKSVKGAEAAIHMDFGNYTMGRLVRGRGNYDYNHKGYRAVRRQIERRILDLGYDADRFKAVDHMVGQSAFYGRQSNDGQKTDRYGKKYSWIAYFEVAGRLALRGRLPDHWEVRISDTDIDPSFPANPLEWKPHLKDLYAKPFTNAADWLQYGSSPQYRDILVPDSIADHEGPWVLLEGYLSEGTLRDHRQTFSFLRGVIVSLEDVPKLQAAVENTDYPGNSKIPDPRDEYYLFSGEIGWSNKYGRRKPGRPARPDVGEAFSGREARRVTKRYGDLNLFEEMILSGRTPFDTEDSDASPGGRIEYSIDDLVLVDEYERIPGVNVEVPVRRLSWESYHSEENQSGGATYPSPALVDRLALRKRGSQVDLFDKDGELATLYRVFNSDSPDERGRLLYLRADLIADYLRQRRKVLVWINWGEREMHYSVAEGLRNDPKVQALWGKHTHIHKEFFVYDRITREAQALATSEALAATTEI